MTRPRLVEAIRQSGGGPVRVTAIRAASPRTVEATRRSDGPAPVVTIVREPARAVELLRQGVKGPIYMVARDVLAVGGIPTGQLLTNISDVTALADATWAEVEDARREFGDLRASIQAAANVGGSAQAEVTAARRGFADLLASVSAAALSATWSQVVNRPLTLADLDSAAATDLTNTRTELVAARGPAATVGARITAEETLRASEDAALAGRATTLEAAVFDGVTGLAATRARLTTEETTRANADSALAVRATNLETEVTAARQGQASVSARLSQIDVARSDGDAALAGRATTLEAQMADTAGSGLRSRIATEEAVRASADTALAGRATTLEAQMADTAGSGLRSRIATEEIARANADSALAVRATDLETEVTGARQGQASVAARLSQIDTARSTGDAALAERATNLETEVTGARQGQASVAARLSQIDTARSDGDTALAVRATNLETEVTAARQGQASVSARLSQIDVARSDGDAALAGRATTLEAQMADTAGSGLRSRIATEEAVRASADTALAGRATTLEAQMADTAASGLRSRIATEEIARANADSALATRATTLEARATAVERAAIQTEATNNNPQFLLWEENGNTWYTGGQKPVGWVTLWGQGTYTRHVNADGRVVLRQTAPAGLNEWLETLTGPANEYPEVSPGRHLLKATAALVSGTFSGAFAYAAWFDASYNFIAADWITLWSTPTIAGTAVGAGTAGVVHTWSKEIDLPANARRVRIAAMGHWSAGDISAANSIDWYECSLTPMSAAEINSTVNIPLLDARITTEEAARIAGDSAEAVARTTLAAKLELTGNLFPDPNGSRGTAFLNAYPDSAPSKWTNPSAGDTWLKEWAAYPSGFDGWRVAYYDIPAGPGTYTGSAYVARTANIVPSMYMVALDGAGTALAYSGVTPAFPASPSSYNQRVVTASPLVAPAGTATIRLVIQVNGAGAIGQYANYSLRQIQIETGSVATVFNESGQNRAIAATVEQNSGAIATLNGATAWWQLLVNASGGLPAIFRLLSGQGGSEMLLAAARVVLANVDGTIVREALRLISGNVHIVNKLFVGASIELDPTAQAIILTAASARLVLGIGFGTSSDLVVWFGPVLALADMTQANATFALTTTGGGRFRDTLLIGSLTNSGQTTLLDNAAEIVVGPFGTLGNTKTVVLSYSAVWERSGTWGIASQTYAVSAVIKIDRRLGAGTWTEIGTLNASGSVELEQDLGPDPDTLVGSMSGSLTITDTTGGTSDFSYRGRITSRTDPGGFGNPDSQRVSVASIE